MSLVWSLDRVTQVVTGGLVYYPFHFGGKNNPEHARKNCKVLRVRREGEFFTIPTVFALEGSIEKKNCFKMEWYSFCSYMGPNQERIMNQMVSRLRVWSQVSFIKTGTYKGIGQRLIGFCVYVSVVGRRFATGDVFVYLQEITFWIFKGLVWLSWPKYRNHYYFF